MGNFLRRHNFCLTVFPAEEEDDTQRLLQSTSIDARTYQQFLEEKTAKTDELKQQLIECIDDNSPPIITDPIKYRMVASELGAVDSSIKLMMTQYAAALQNRELLSCADVITSSQQGLNHDHVFSTLKKCQAELKRTATDNKLANARADLADELQNSSAIAEEVVQEQSPLDDNLDIFAGLSPEMVAKWRDSKKTAGTGIKKTVVVRKSPAEKPVVLPSFASPPPQVFLPSSTPKPKKKEKKDKDKTAQMEE